MAKRYWPPAIPSFTAGSVRIAERIGLSPPLIYWGCQQRLQIHSWARRWCLRVLWHDSRFLSLGSQGSGSVQDVFSFRMREQINLQIFFGLEKETYQSCWCWGSPRLMIPQKASLVFQRTNCYVSWARDVWTDFLKCVFTLTTDCKSTAVFSPFTLFSCLI